MIFILNYIYNNYLHILLKQLCIGSLQIICIKIEVNQFCFYYSIHLFNLLRKKINNKINLNVRGVNRKITSLISWRLH